MKYRYFMLPFIIIFYMILVIDFNSEIVNKVLIDSNRTINYPFFDNDNIDLFIENYLNRTSNNYSDDIFIDYDGYLKENKFFLSFYKYIVGSGKISNDIDSFIIDLNHSPGKEVLARLAPNKGIEELSERRFRIFFDEDYSITEKYIEESVANDWDLKELLVERCSLDRIFAQLSGKIKE